MSNRATPPFGRVYSGPRVAIPSSGKNERGDKPLVFTQSLIWTSPSSGRLRRAVGRGENGRPAVPGVLRWRVIDVQTDTIYDNEQGLVKPGATTRVVHSTHDDYPSLPANYSSDTWYSWGFIRTQHTFSREQYTAGAVAEYTGQPATAFGLVFPGGVGIPAEPVTFTGVPIAAGGKYQIIVPVGGFIRLHF